MAAPSYTNTLTNTTTADADEVQQNFTDILNGVSDGTKDLSINALTCAGAVTLNSDITLGNASSDDIAVTGSIASSIPVKTNASFNFGGATTGLLSVYLGNTSDTIRLIAPSLSASYTLTLPDDGGTTGQFAVTNGSGTLSWRFEDVTQAKTAAYTALTSDTIILCDSSSATFAVTVPAAAAGNSGKRLIIKKTDSSTTSVTTDTGFVSTLHTEGESVEIVSDGSSWNEIRRTIPTKTVSWSPSGTWAANTTYSGYWSRVGDRMECEVAISLSGAPTATALQVDLPSGITIDTAKLASTQTSNCLGVLSALDSGAGMFGGLVLYVDSNTVAARYTNVADDGNPERSLDSVDESTPHTFANGDYVHMRFSFPVSDWNS